MNRSVEQAVEDIRRLFPSDTMDVEPDTNGGAFVTIHGIDLGSLYEPTTSFIGFHITFQYPHADVYPHFLVAGLKRKDEKPLGEGFHAGKEWKTPARTLPATMVSRRSNHLNPAIDTAATKLQKVLEWIRNR